MNPASLANLRPGAGAGRPGQAPALKHGARTTSPQHSPLWSPALRDAVADLAGRVGAELRDEHGELQPWALPSVEAVAIQRVACIRIERKVSDLEDRGEVDPALIDLQSKVGERYHRALEREALTLRSRLETQGAALDLAQLAAERQRRRADVEATATEGEAEGDRDPDA